MKSHRILPAAVLLCTLAAACGESPTGATQARPGGASYDDGGYTIGSGNSARQAGGGLTTGTEGTAGATGGTTSTTAESDDGTQRGGYTIGSGN